MKKISRLAVLTSGGDAPGMNAAIRAVVRTATYHNIEVFGVYRGYTGLIEDEFLKIESASFVSNIIQRGGTILKTSRCLDFHQPAFRKKAYANLEKRGIEAMAIIGGNGSFKGAQIFSSEYDIACVGIPGTIDKDIVGTDYTIGFDTAINTAIDAIDKIRDTAEALDRIFVVEVMGRDAGYIALYSGLSTGAQEVFIPERDTKVQDLIDLLTRKDKRKKAFSVVIVAEGNKNGDATTIGKIIKEKLPNYDVRVAILGHIQRGGTPTALDRIIASRLGHEGVNALLAGQRSVMIGIKNDNMVTLPFSSVEKEPMADVEKWAKMLQILSS